MNSEYYIIEGKERRGPFSLEDLAGAGITADTLVWRQGLPDWVKASELPELSSMLIADDSAFGAYAQTPPEPYFAMIGNRRVGPSDPASLAAEGIGPDTPVWRSGMGDWAPASTQPEVMAAINAFRSSVPPSDPGMRFGQPRFAPGQQAFRASGYDQYSTPHTNWMTWAIVGTIVGFLFSCIGVIFGIIGIVQANKANEAYAMGNTVGGEQANNTAKTMSIIALAFGGIGLITTVVGTITGLFHCVF